MSEVAGIVTAIAAVLTALGGVVLALAVLVPTMRASRKAVEQVAEVHTSVAEVHGLVNQQRTDMLRYQAALVDVLMSAGIPIPADQSLMGQQSAPRKEG